MAYSGDVDLINGLRPKNSGNFPLVAAKDVYVDDATRLDVKLQQLGSVAGELSDLKSAFDDAVGVPAIEITSLADQPGGTGSMTAAGKWANVGNSAYQHKYVHLERTGGTLNITGGIAGTYIAFVETYPTPVNNQSLDFSSAEDFTTPIWISAGTAYEFDAPNDAHYIVVVVATNTNGSNSAPAVFKVTIPGDPGELSTQIDNLDERTTALESNATTTNAKIAATNAMIAPVEASNTAEFPHLTGEFFAYNGAVYAAIAPIAVGDMITPGTNCYEVPNGIANDLGGKISSIATETQVWNTVSGAASFDATYTGKAGNGTETTTPGVYAVVYSGNESYDSYEIYLASGDVICAPGELPNYYSMSIGTEYALSDGQPAWNEAHNKLNCASAARYRKSDNDLPTEENPFVCTGRTVLIVTVTAGATPAFKKGGNSFALTDAVSAIETQKAVNAVKAADLIYVHKKSAWFYVFVPAYSGKYIRYAIQHYTTQDGVTDVCEIRQVDLYNGHELIGTNNDRYNDGVIFPIAIEGQWELAIQTAIDNEFIGGKNHGHERIITGSDNVYNLWFFVDGKAVQPSTNADFTCKTFAFMSNTKLYHIANDPATPVEVAVHRNKTTIAQGRIEMEQAVEWAVSETIKDSYICMLPMCRGNDGNSDIQVTAFGYDYLTYTPYDISVAGFDNYMHDQIPGRTKITEYGPASGIEATAEIIGSFGPGQYGYIRNGGSSGNPPTWTHAYNKMYMSYDGSSQPVTAGEKWSWKNIYTITHVD